MRPNNDCVQNAPARGPGHNIVEPIYRPPAAEANHRKEIRLPKGYTWVKIPARLAKEFELLADSASDYYPLPVAISKKVIAAYRNNRYEEFQMVRKLLRDDRFEKARGSVSGETIYMYSGHDIGKSRPEAPEGFIAVEIPCHILVLRGYHDNDNEYCCKDCYEDPEFTQYVAIPDRFIKEYGEDDMSKIDEWLAANRPREVRERSHRDRPLKPEEYTVVEVPCRLLEDYQYHTDHGFGQCWEDERCTQYIAILKVVIDNFGKKDIDMIKNQLERGKAWKIPGQHRQDERLEDRGYNSSQRHTTNPGLQFGRIGDYGEDNKFSSDSGYYSLEDE